MPFFPKAVIFLIIAATMAFFLDREESRGSLEIVDTQYRSWLMANSRAEVLEPSVTYLTIDDPGQRVYGNWPLGPVDYSILIDNLSKNEPKVIAVAPVLGWRGTSDGILVNSVRSVLFRMEKGEILLGAELFQNPSGEPIRPSTLSLFPRLEKVSGDRSYVPEFTQAGLLPEPSLMATGPIIGFTRIDLGDSEAKRERDSFTVPLLARHGETLVPSFILMAIVMEAGVGIDAVEVSFDERLIRISGVKPIDIPIDRGGRLSVHTGIQDAISKYDADILILDGQSDIRDQLKPEEKKALLSRIVILGTDDEIARTIELPKTKEKISQAELFAMAIATIQAKRFIRKVPRGVEFGIWGGLALLGLLLIRAQKRGDLLLRWIVLVILFFVGSWMLFEYSGQWAPLVAQIGIIVCILLVGLLLPMVRAGESPTAEPPPQSP